RADRARALDAQRPRLRSPDSRASFGGQASPQPPAPSPQPPAPRLALLACRRPAAVGLHVKYLAITIVFVLAGLASARRPSIALAACGVLSLAAFHVWAFETPLGARGASELTSSPSRFAMVVLGLHLDQSQGMFVQNPLLLAGVAALPLFARVRPRTALVWTMLYA